MIAVILLALYATLNIVDCRQTVLGLRIGCFETNVAARVSLERFGNLGLLIYQWAWFLAIACFVFTFPSQWAVAGLACALVACAVAGNHRVLSVAKRGAVA